MKPFKKTLFLALGALAVGLAANTAFGQDHGGKKGWLELFSTTGWVGWLMVLCSVAGVSLVVEHIVSLRREKLAPDSLAQELEALLDEEQFDDAIELCDEEGGFLAHLIGSALRMRHAGYEEMIAGLEAAANEETFKLNTKISYLNLLGNIAPLLGLLGTVTGMITSFQKIETMKSPSPADLAVGVYESLVNTTMGLFLAIVFLSIYFVFKNKVSKMALSINLQAVDLLRHMAGTTAVPKH